MIYLGTIPSSGSARTRQEFITAQLESSGCEDCEAARIARFCFSRDALSRQVQAVCSFLRGFALPASYRKDSRAMDTLNLSDIQSEEDKTAFVPWGCELNQERRSCIFKVKEDFLEHLPFLRMIFLGPEAKDELHVIAVECNSTCHGKPVPVASLRTSVLPMINVNGLELSPPVTFILKSGTGPVYICAQHLTLEEDLEESGLTGEDSHEIELDRGDLQSPDEFSSYFANGINQHYLKYIYNKKGHPREMLDECFWQIMWDPPNQYRFNHLKKNLREHGSGFGASTLRISQ